MAYVTKEDANAYISQVYPGTPALIIEEVTAAEIDADSLIKGTFDTITSRKLDPADLTAEQLAALGRAIAEQAVYRREMAPGGGHSFQIQDELEVIRTADGTERNRARSKFSPKGRMYLLQTGLNLVGSGSPPKLMSGIVRRRFS